MNKKHYFLFIVKNISCIQFSLCHTSDEKFLTPNFSQTTVSMVVMVFSTEHITLVVSHDQT